MEGSAGSDQLNPTDAEEPTDTTDEAVTAASDDADVDGVTRQNDNDGLVTDHTVGDEVVSEDEGSGEPVDPEAPAEEPAAEPVAAVPPGVSRMNRTWFVGIAAGLVAVAVVCGIGGYAALRSHGESVQLAKAETQAIAAAIDCVTATNAPNAQAMAVSQEKIINCSTGDFGAYATMMAPIMLDAYQAAQVSVQVTEMRAAVEKHNPDGSIDVLVAFRFKVPSNPNTQEAETGLRLRAQMAPVDGTYKIAKLEPVMT